MYKYFCPGTVYSTGSDEILRKNVDGAHLHHKEILHAKFGKIGLLDFAAARVHIHTYGRTRYSVHAIRTSPYRSCTNKFDLSAACPQ